MTRESKWRSKQWNSPTDNLVIKLQLRVRQCCTIEKKYLHLEELKRGDREKEKDSEDEDLKHQTGPSHSVTAHPQYTQMLTVCGTAGCLKPRKILDVSIKLFVLKKTPNNALRSGLIVYWMF